VSSVRQSALRPSSHTPAVRPQVVSDSGANRLFMCDRPLVMVCFSGGLQVSVPSRPGLSQGVVRACFARALFDPFHLCRAHTAGAPSVRQSTAPRPSSHTASALPAVRPQVVSKSGANSLLMCLTDSLSDGVLLRWPSALSVSTFKTRASVREW
jgi:hypothetical protein